MTLPNVSTAYGLLRLRFDIENSTSPAFMSSREHYNGPSLNTEANWLKSLKMDSFVTPNIHLDSAHLPFIPQYFHVILLVRNNLLTLRLNQSN